MLDLRLHKGGDKQFLLLIINIIGKTNQEMEFILIYMSECLYYYLVFKNNSLTFTLLLTLL